MKNIHVLPTDKPSRLADMEGLLVFGDDLISPIGHPTMFLYRHIYITSNEVIKEGDFSFYPPFGVGVNIVINGELCFHIKSKKGKGSFTQRTYQTLDKNKKIILTTDQDLIKDGVQAIDDEFLEWFVKNPNCESVEVSYEVLKPFQSEEKGYLIHCPDNEVLEEPKQETLEEASWRFNPLKKLDGEFLRAAFIEGARWQAERMYSEAIEFAEWIRIKDFQTASKDNWIGLDMKYYTTQELFEQFKKK